MSMNESHGFDDEANNNANETKVMPSSDQNKLSSLVVGDGGFEAMLKERTRVSLTHLHNGWTC